MSNLAPSLSAKFKTGRFLQPARLRPATLAVVAAVLVIVSLASPLNSYSANILSSTGCAVIVLLGLMILFGTAGQMAFSHVFFMAVGAYLGSILVISAHLPFVVAGLVAIAVSAGFAYICALMLLRLRSFYLAAASLILPLLVTSAVTLTATYSGGLDGLAPVLLPVPTVGEYMAIIWAIAVVVYWMTGNLVGSPVGRAWAAVRDDETASLALGVDARKYKLRAYVISSAVAALGGFLIAPVYGALFPGTFDLTYMIQLVMALVVGGMFWPFGAVIGAVVLVLLPQELSSYASYNILIYAVILLVVLRFLPSGLVGAVLRLAQSATDRLSRRSRDSAPAPGSAPGQPEADPGRRRPPLQVRERPGAGPDPDTTGDLVLEHIDVRFGGLEVLSDVSVRVRPGGVRGLIGPNGAGKTTLFNVASGFVSPARGEIRLAGARIDAMSPAERAAAGIARTFQAVHMFDELSVLDNVTAGMHTHLRDGLIPCALDLPAVRAQKRSAREEARELLDWIGLGHLASRSPRGLPFGSLKLIEIARALAMRPKFLLMDEPVGGLHPQEIELLEHLIATICEMGVGVLLVEHNVPFVLRACNEILVLNYGHVIADGTSDDIVNSEAVVEAYLGGKGVKS